MSPGNPHQHQRDQDCAFLARHALFPWQINRDGSHNTIFPALDALGKIRDDAIEANPDKTASSFFPARVVIVRATAGVDGAVTWNGQPDIGTAEATFDVIPHMISVKCMECSKLQQGLKAFTQRKNKNKPEEGREIVLCTDRLLQKDYIPDKVQDLPKKSLAAVSEALTHELVKVGEMIKFERDSAAAATTATRDPTTCTGLAAVEILAARAAECYFQKEGKDVKRGSGLPVGYSLYPSFLQTYFRNKCVLSVATENLEREFKGNGRKCVADVLPEV